MFDSFKLCDNTKVRDINMREKEKHFSPVIGGSKHYIRQGKAVERPQSKSIWNEPWSEDMYFNLQMFNHCTLDENPTGGYLAWISPIEAG